MSVAGPTSALPRPGLGRLRDRVAVVVGAGQTPGDTIGNGRATAIVFAREGARVVLVDRDQPNDPARAIHILWRRPTLSWKQCGSRCGASPAAVQVGGLDVGDGAGSGPRGSLAPTGTAT